MNSSFDENPPLDRDPLFLIYMIICFLALLCKWHHSDRLHEWSKNELRIELRYIHCKRSSQFVQVDDIEHITPRKRLRE